MWETEHDPPPEMAPPPSLEPVGRNVSPAWPKGFAGGIKLRRVDGELNLGYLGGLSVIPRVLEIGREVGREPERQ